MHEITSLLTGMFFWGHSPAVALHRIQLYVWASSSQCRKQRLKLRTLFWFTFYCITKHSDGKQSGEGKVDLAHTSKSQPITENIGEDTQEEQVGGTENETTEECCLLACFSWLLHTQDHLPSVPQCAGHSHMAQAPGLSSSSCLLGLLHSYKCLTLLDVKAGAPGRVTIWAGYLMFLSLPGRS